jgi:predicted dehydrogenase
MHLLETINLGIVGCAGRGGSFRRSVAAIPALRLAALCDINAQGLAKAADELQIDRTFTDYHEMLDKGQVDAVIIGTPMPLHVPQATAALDRGIHVISEVPAGVSVEECRRLVEACRRSPAVYMMAENYTYSKPNQVIREMVRRGEFGTVYYAEGEYLHELKGLNEVTRWRRKWQTGIDGITYGTHSLGPILQWFEGDRVEHVCCAGSSHHYRDPRGDQYEAQDTGVMLCRMRSGGLVKIRVDMLSDRPHAMSNYQLQGTDGAYESARARGETNRIWLRSKAPKPEQWQALDALWDQYIPESWRKFEELAKKAGHGGGDLLELIDFADAITAGKPCPIGIDHAMDMTLPGLLSQESVRRGGQWLPVPDSRAW